MLFLFHSRINRLVVKMKSTDLRIENISSVNISGETKPSPRSRFKSRFSEFVRNEIEECKCLHRTMGYAEISLNPPENFLKAGSGIHKQTKLTNHTCYRREQPSIPKFERLRCQSAHIKNFKLINIQSLAASKPRKSRTQDLFRSGMVPFYVNQSKFGEIPEYLKRRKNELQMLNEIARRKEIRRQPLHEFVTQHERNVLIRGLKNNFHELQREYRSLPVLTNTVKNQTRKMELEAKLRQLEQDILLVDLNPFIYVYHNNVHNLENTKQNRNLMRQSGSKN